ncbi:glycosyltransferase [Sedimenticola thiotaurini]|uniref:Glycosyltransferase n=1 Tax=Sedimenticola thiotaurini TaxID=1543721 RepID=A0A0F7K1L3_9GAMM|nr:glycosyltransferase [Sedimenticola thiotaurini]AKH20843.1 glycosyltransferase [Sedimenticola thiotaurini]
MRVLFVNHLLDPVSGGGTAERTLQLARFMSKESMDCGILTLDIGDLRNSEKKLSGVPVYRLPCIYDRYFIPAPGRRSVTRLLLEYDVVHLMGHWTLLNAIVAIICLRKKKPYVVCPAGALKNYGRSRWLKRIFDFVIGKRIIRYASAWVAVTEDEKLDFAGYGIKPKSIIVIPNGVDPVDYQSQCSSKYRKELLLERRFSLDGQPYILFLGRLNKIKGPDLLLEAFATVIKTFPDLHLVFAGPDAGLMESLKVYSSTMGIAKSVHFAGYIKGDEKVNALLYASCLVIPSREEAMSIVVLEAGMCSTPVIFTDRCGLNEFALKGAGIEVQANVNSIAKALIRMLSSPEQMKESGTILNRLVRKSFSWSTQAQRYRELYKNMREFNL